MLFFLLTLYASKYAYMDVSASKKIPGVIPTYNLQEGNPPDLPRQALGCCEMHALRTLPSPYKHCVYRRAYLGQRAAM